MKPIVKRYRRRNTESSSDWFSRRFLHWYELEPLTISLAEAKAFGEEMAERNALLRLMRERDETARR